MIAEFATTILYTQVIAYLPGLDAPGLDWSDDHVAQGFAWAPGTVSFGVPDHDGECLVRVATASAIALNPASLWAIRVPFDVTASPVRIGTIMLDRDVDVPTGRYSLVFEALPGTLDADHDYAYIFDLTFCVDPRPDFAILRQGVDLATDTVLRTDAGTV